MLIALREAIEREAKAKMICIALKTIDLVCWP